MGEREESFRTDIWAACREAVGRGGWCVGHEVRVGVLMSMSVKMQEGGF